MMPTAFFTISYTPLKEYIPGYDSSELRQKAIQNLSHEIDVIIPVPVDETHKIQELHIVVYHALCIFVEENLPKNFLI